MKKFYFPLLLLFFFWNQGFSQCTDWEWLNPYPQSNDLEDVKWVSESKAFAIGDRGVLVRTLDAGATWEVMPQLISYNYQTLYFSSPMIGYAAGVINNAGIIIKTIDGGDTWFQLDIGVGVPNTIGSLWFVNDNLGYAGSFGKILKTTNGGVTWTVKTINISYTFQSLYFFDELNGFAQGGSYIYRTVDGGLTWTQVLSASTLLNDISFADVNVGFAGFSSSGYYYKTVNGGATWTQVASGFGSTVRTVYFANALVGYMATTAERIYQTTDGGTTWTQVYLDVSQDVNAFHSWGDNHVLAVGNFGRMVISSTGGGNGSWTMINQVTPLSPNAMHMIDENTGFFASYGTISKTTDGGESFVHTTIPTSQQPFAMSFPSPDSGFVVGANGLRYRTINGGNTWINQSVSNTTSLYFDVFFRDHLNGYYCGSNGLLMKTIDGGLNWNSLGSDQTQTLRGVWFLNADTGYVCGASGTLLRTVNGGDTWTSVNPGTTAYLLSLYFYNDQLGFCVGESGTLLRTANGGETWTSASAGWGDDITEVKMLDENVGYFSTSDFNGAIYRTWNGGLNWSYYAIMNNQTIEEFDIVDANTIVAIGTGAGVWKIHPKIPTPLVPDNVNVCSGGTVDGMSPDPAYTTRWVTSAFAGSWIQDGPAFDVSLLPPSGDVWVMYLDSLECQSIPKKVHITVSDVSAPPVIEATITAICPGESTVIQTSDGGDVLWSNGEVGSSIVVNEGGSYSAQINEGSCISDWSSPIDIVVHPLPDTPVILVPDYDPCAPGEIILSTETTYQAAWLDDLGETLVTNVNEFTIENPSTEQTFGLQYTNEFGCVGEAVYTTIETFEVPIPPVISSDDIAFCPGFSSVIYTIDNSEVLWSNGVTAASIEVSTEAAFTAIAVSADGCQSEVSNTVNIYLYDAAVYPEVVIGEFDVCGDAVDIAVTNTNYLYWYNADMQQISVDDADFTTLFGNTDLTYYVQAVSDFDCLSGLVEINIDFAETPAAPMIDAVLTDLCEGQSTVVSSADGSEVLWSTGEFASSIVVDETIQITATYNGGVCESDPAI
ncbi:MAG: WD40/YVTN/BNR-like repeat-containing protein, partial [Flavobacteriales bacterium]